MIVGRDIPEIEYLVNKCEGVKRRGIKEIKQKIEKWAKGECIIPLSAPFGWPEAGDLPPSKVLLKYVL